MKLLVELCSLHITPVSNYKSNYSYSTVMWKSCTVSISSS